VPIVAGYFRARKPRGKIIAMAENRDTRVATHFGRQMRKERLARGWSLAEFSQRAGINAGHLSRIENGRRPATRKVAEACDAVFRERRGWFTDWYDESLTWSEVPAGFRNWTEIEDKAASVRAWSPGVIHGLLQTEDYARALLATAPEVTDEAVTTRLTARMERQRRSLLRDGDPPAAWFIIDELSLHRLVGSPETMATQMRHLLSVAAMPRVTAQVLPAVAHPAGASGFLLADESAWVEHVAGGFVYTGEAVSSLSRLFDSLRGESYRVSESAALLERMCELWATGASPAIPTLTAEIA
jgi:transcriptional regulator with XRE-family HTH domain